MQKLSDTQLVIVAAACHRADRNLLPLPVNLKGGAAQKVVASLLAKGLAEEQPAAAAGAPAWREGEDGQRFTLLATDAAFEALGIEPEIKEAGPIEQQDDNAAADEQTEPAPEPEPSRAQDSCRDQAGRPRGNAAPARRRQPRRDRRGDRMAGPHRPWRDRRRAQEEARPYRHVRKGRRQGTGLQGRELTS
jgi:hypothetical protein